MINPIITCHSISKNHAPILVSASSSAASCTGSSLGNQEIMGRSTDFLAETCGKNVGKIEENHGKNHWKILGKSLENHGITKKNIRKIEEKHGKHMGTSTF